MTDWTGVRDRVLALGAVSGSDKVFGARAHGFALDATLTAAEVADVDVWLDVDLPEDHRSFLLHVGAGGAGPAYGVLPVRRAGSADWHWVGELIEKVEPGMFAEPFPGGADPAATVGILAERPAEEEFDDLAAAFEQWEERLGEVQYDPRRTAGAAAPGHADPAGTEVADHAVAALTAGPGLLVCPADPGHFASRTEHPSVHRNTHSPVGCGPAPLPGPL